MAVEEVAVAEEEVAAATAAVVVVVVVVSEAIFQVVVVVEDHLPLAMAIGLARGKSLVKHMNNIVSFLILMRISM